MNISDISNLRHVIPITKVNAAENTANGPIFSPSSQSKVAPLEHGYRPFVPGKVLKVDHSLHPVLNGSRQGPTTSEPSKHSNGDKYPVAQVVKYL